LPAAAVDEARAAWTELAAEARARYRVEEYLHDDLGPAMAAADLMVARAGRLDDGRAARVRAPGHPGAGWHSLAATSGTTPSTWSRPAAHCDSTTIRSPTAPGSRAASRC
jgi:hypothetical protein